MDRFGKLFGRKSDVDSQKVGVDADPPAASLPTGDPQNQANHPSSEFGLQFVFDSGETRVFTSLPITIGRSDDNHLILKDDSVSAHHAQIVFDERIKDICILDLDSLNGVFISDHPTRKNILQDGMRIGLGNVHLVYRDTGYIHPA